MLKKWSISLFVTVLGAGFIQLFVFVFFNFSTKTEVSELIPWTFHTLWEVFALGVIVYLVKKCKIDLRLFLALLGIVAFFASIFWAFMPIEIGFIEPNYYGIESRISTASHPVGRFEEGFQYDYALSVGNLYHKDDPFMKADYYASKRVNAYVKLRPFLFWQVGLANGFYPIGIKGYNGGMGFINRLKLFLTVGPMVIIDCFFLGVFKFFLILLVPQIIWFLFEKKHIWWS